MTNSNLYYIGTMMKKAEKIYNKKEIGAKLSKSMYKAVVKAISDEKKDTKEIVDDILDNDNIAEVDPDKIPANKKIKVVHKAENCKLLKSDGKVKKGIDKLRFFLKTKNDDK